LGPPSNGPGYGGGIGSGHGGGVGSGSGGGLGPGDGGGFGGGVYKVGNGVTAPVLLYKKEPEYSEEARKAKYQGTVVLEIYVDPSGRAINPRVLRSLGLGLDEKAVEAVRLWKFKPGYKDGKPVTVAAQIEVNFRLL
jgi:TonB family protein